MTPLSIRRAVLRSLAKVEPFALPLEQLLDDVNQNVRPALTVGQLKEHLSWLLDNSMADFLPDSMDPDNPDARKWLIKEAGSAALKK